MVSQMAEIKVVGRGIGGVVDLHGFQSPVGHHLDIFLKGVFAELIEHRMGENRDSVSLFDEFDGFFRRSFGAGNIKWLPVTKVSAPHAILVLTMRLGGFLRLSMVMI